MDSAQLSNLMLSGTVATSTLRENILAELELNPNPDWGYLLKNMTMAFKQLETMKADVHPSFQLVDVVPQSASIPTIPDMLGTAVSAEDAASLSLDHASTLHGRQADIDRHNSDVQGILAALFPDELDSKPPR